MKSYEKGKLPYIIFGAKSAERLGTELKNADVKRCFIISDSFMIKHPITIKIINMLNSINIAVDIFDKVKPEPTDTLCLELAEKIKEKQYDCVLGIGGGSPTGVEIPVELIRYQRFGGLNI